MATQRRVSRNGGAVRVRSDAQIAESASASVPEGKSKKQRVAPGEYVLPDKWKVIRRYNTGDYARLDAEDREYNQYQKARDWMEKSCNIMLPEHISHPDDLHLWKFYRKPKRTQAGVRIEEWVCPMRHV